MNRITLEPGKRGGKPCIRGLRITVYDILSQLSQGATQQEILECPTSACVRQIGVLD